MNMKCLVCEGKHDLIFLQEYLEKYTKVQGYPVNNKMSDLFDIFRSDYHPFHRGYKCVIYGEGGKSKLFERVVIPCVQEVFGRGGFQHHFFVIVDADGADPDHLCNTYYKAITENICSRKITRYSCRPQNDGSCHVFFSPRDERYQCMVKTTHIPTSLESELVLTGLDKLQGHITRKTKERMLSVPIHDALRSLSAHVEMTVEEIIKQSVNDEWFIDKPWFIEINQGLGSFLGIEMHSH
jgi:hypothetical protein